MKLKDVGLANWISLCRVLLGLVFLICYRSVTGPLLTISIVVAIMAQISDHIDGYVVRKSSTPSVRGWLFDSFSDRAFYIAALLAFERELQLDDALVWAFILREIALYAIRIAVGDFELLLPGFRKLALLHAAIVRAAIVVGCLLPFSLPFREGALNFRILAAAVFCATILGFANLYFLLRKLP